MRRIFKLILGLILCLPAIHSARAFSMKGPAADWMTVRLGYDLNNLPLFGPMSVGEEYRWNIPTVYYIFSSDFLNYFGARGEKEVDKAFQILNELPSMDAVNMDEYPLSAQRVNHRAQSLGLLDLKSTALSLLVNDMGLLDPTRFVFTLRSRWIGAGGAPTNYFVVKRNFDPVTWQHSSYINGQLWTYNSISDGDTRSIVNCEPVDPLALLGLINAPVSSGFSGNGFLLSGGFWTGLTRDDIGGLRYLYRSGNVNNENAPTNSLRAASGSASSSSGSSPWEIPVVPGGGTAVTIPGASTNFFNTALRPGVGKINFVKVVADSNVGLFLSNNVTWTDQYINNGRASSQTLVRPQFNPDIVFHGADIQGPAEPGALVNGSVTVALTYFDAYENNDLINGAGGNYGPGTITGTRSITFNTVGPMILNIFPDPQGFNSEVDNAGVEVIWGSFDGSTDEPFVYPYYTTIQELEQTILGGASGASGGNGQSTISEWSPAVIPATTTVVIPAGSSSGG